MTPVYPLANCIPSTLSVSKPNAERISFSLTDVVVWAHRGPLSLAQGFDRPDRRILDALPELEVFVADVGVQLIGKVERGA